MHAATDFFGFGKFVHVLEKVEELTIDELWMWSYPSQQPKQTNTTEQNVNKSIFCTLAKTEEEVLNDKSLVNLQTFSSKYIPDLWSRCYCRQTGDIIEPLDAIHGGLLVDSRLPLMGTRLEKTIEMT